MGMGRVRSILRHMSIRRKLYAIFILSALLPLLLISAYSYQRNSDQLLEQAYGNLDSMALQVNVNVDNQLSLLEQASFSLFANTTLNSILIYQYTAPMEFVEAYYDINSLLFGMSRTHGYLKNIEIYTTNHTLPSDGLFILHLDSLSERTPSGDTSQPYAYGWYEGITRHKDGYDEFSYLRIMNYADSQRPYAILRMSMQEALLAEIYQQEAVDKLIYVIDEKGYIISTEDKTLLGQPFETALGAAVPSGNGRTALTTNQGETLAAYNTLSNGWQTVCLTPLGGILDTARQTASQIWLITLISTSLAVFLVLSLTRNLSRRFRLLGERVIRMENADFAVAPHADMGADELGDLSNSFDHLSTRLDVLINELYKKELLKKDAELSALQSQINPHFLYNALSLISSQARSAGEEGVANTVQHLSRFYQGSLEKGNRYIPLSRELDITRNYLAIQHQRFDSLFTDHWEIDENTLNCIVPKLILQPLVENALGHATDGKLRRVTIWLRAYILDETLYLEVEDDGVGMTPDKAEALVSDTPQYGYGIYNIQQRIALSFGDAYGVTVHSQVGLGTKMTITLPASHQAPSFDSQYKGV